jgi:hypothetical protein
MSEPETFSNPNVFLEPDQEEEAQDANKRNDQKQEDEMNSRLNFRTSEPEVLLGNKHRNDNANGDDQSISQCSNHLIFHFFFPL